MTDTPQNPKHTPGPWVIEYVPSSVERIDIWTDGSSICQIQLPEGQDYANAQLIAAAPNLLAALKVAVQVWKRTNDRLPIGKRQAIGPIWVVDAEIAIAKAEGGAA